MKKILRNSQVLTIVLVILALSSVFFSIESVWAAEEPEPLSMSTVQDVNILGSGTALVTLSINVGASPLADMYRELLAAPDDADVGEEMPIPENRTGEGEVAPVRQEYYRSIKQEQEASFGFATSIFNSSMVPRGEQGECRVSVNACVLPQIVNITDVGSEVILEVVVGPKDENATGLALGFALNKIGFAQMMLESLEGDQVFELEWTTRIKVPTEAVLLNGDELSTLSWAVNFGGGTSMSASVDMDGPSTIVLSERTLVTEQNMTATPTEVFEAFSGYKVFSIRYQLPKSAFVEDEDERTSTLGNNWSKRWSWWVRPTRSLPFEEGPISGTLTVTPTFSLTVYMGWKWGGFLGLKLQWFKAWISVHVSVKFELDATITTAAKDTFEKTLFDENLYRFSFSIGCVPVTADLDLSFVATVTLGASANEVTLLSTDVEVGASFKAGVRWRREAKGDIPSGWSTIWEKNNYGSLYDLDVAPWRTDAFAEAFVRPRLSFMVYGLTGPFVEFGPYFSMDNDYHDSLDVAKWKVDTGWKLNWGVTFADILKDLLGLKTHTVPLKTWPTETWEGHWGIATSSISIDLKPWHAIYIGSGAMVTGRISSDYAGNKRGKVYIEYSTDEINWTSVGSTYSNADGDYSYWWVVWEAGTFYVRSWWEGNSGYEGATSASAILIVSSVVTGAQVLLYDDNDPDWPDFPEYPKGFAVRFTSPASIWKLEKIHVYGAYLNLDADFYVEIWDSNQNELFRGTYRLSDYFPRFSIEEPPVPPDWAAKGEGIDIPDIYVAGDFYVVISGDPNEDYGLWIWLDWDWDPTPHRSYEVNLADNSITESMYENYMIRAEGTSIVKFHGLNIHTGAFPNTMTEFKITDNYIFSHIQISTTETINSATWIRWEWYTPDGNVYQADDGFYDPGWDGLAYASTPIEDNRTFYEQYLGRPFTVKIWYCARAHSFLAVAATETFIVTKFRSSISVWLSSDSITYGNTVDISSLTRPFFVDGTTTLRYSIDEVTWTDIAAGTPSSWPPGFYSNTWTPPHVGTYYIRAAWSGNLNYAGNISETLTLMVNPAPTILSTSISSTTIIQGFNVTITTTLTLAITDTPLQDKDIIIQYSTDNFTWYILGINTTDSLGQCTYKWAPDVGVYYIRSTWYGEENYLGTDGAGVKLTVEPKVSTIVEVVSGADAEVDRNPEGTVEFKVRVKDEVSGQYLTSIGRVQFYVSDQSYYRNILIGSDNDTDGDGIYQIQWTVNDSWPVLGLHPWGAYFVGTPEYMPSSASSTFTIYYCGVALWIDTTFQEVNITSTEIHTINFKWNRETTDTFNLSLIGLDPAWYTLSQTSINFDTKGQTEQVTLTISLPNAPTILKDYDFTVTATSQEAPSFSVSATSTLRVRFTPTLPPSPTGDLAIAVQPKTIYMLTGTTTSINILVVNNQNFDDVITIDLRNTGIQPQYQANLTWFNWIRVRVFLPAGASISIPLEIELPADTPLGIYDFRAVATSTSDFAVTAEDSGTINAADITPPTTTITLTGTLGLNGWYISDVTVALTAIDDLSGVASTEYSFDGANWIPYTGPFTISSEGTTTVYYRSIDNAGNIEPTNTATLILDKTPPTTTLTIGEPKYVSDTTYVTLDTQFTLEPTDTGSGVYSTVYKIYNATYDSGWQTYTAPFKLTSLTDGIYIIEYNSIDNAGNVEPTHTVSVTLDNSGPSILVENPPPGWALQDGVTFIASASDSSGTKSLNISIREANGAGGIPVGFEDIPATFNAITGKWELFLDTLQLPDGFYIVLVNAEDNLGHTASITVPYSIRNWAVLELLPASENNKAGRTMPVKFALRVAASVDPNQPFVYNEELTIKIYATDDQSNILQTSTFGDTARDYRINTLAEQYITNFRTLKTPKTYMVEIWKKDMLIGTFDFNTVK